MTRAPRRPEGLDLNSAFAWHGSSPAADGCHEWNGALTTNGYGRIRWMGRQYMAHRVAYEAAYGSVPKDMDIDHICHNRACVNVDHLRQATRKQNAENRGTIRTSSGVRGVTWDRAKGKWHAQVTHNGRNHYVGRFHDLQDAAAAVRQKRRELFTHSID